MIENNEKIEKVHVSLTPEGKSIVLSERVSKSILENNEKLKRKQV